jgi:hypothetical protein
MPGVSVLDNIVEAIHISYKVILVLTDLFSRVSGESIKQTRQSYDL